MTRLQLQIDSSLRRIILIMTAAESVFRAVVAKLTLLSSSQSVRCKMVGVFAFSLQILDYWSRRKGNSISKSPRGVRQLRGTTSSFAVARIWFRTQSALRTKTRSWLSWRSISRRDTTGKAVCFIAATRVRELLAFCWKGLASV